MSLSDNFADDAANIFLDQDAFGQEATYTVDSTGEQKNISIVFELWNDKVVGNTFSNEGTVTAAWVWLAEAEIPEPRIHDRVLIGGVNWEVFRILESGGGMFKLQVGTDEAPLRLF